MVIPGVSDFYYEFGHIDLPWTNYGHRALSYRREPFNNQDDIDKWKAQGHTHTHYTGEMYDMQHPWPSWLAMKPYMDEFPWAHLSWSFYKMTTGTILPEHVDTFKRFKELHEYNDSTIYRAVIMLEDWAPGHVLTVADKQFPQWKAGDFVRFHQDVPHMAANLGLEDRYTLQLTGFGRR